MSVASAGDPNRATLVEGCPTGGVSENPNPPLLTELVYYREMSTAPLGLNLPNAGYGPEPVSERDVVLQAGGRLQATLPSDWSVKVLVGTDSREGARLDIERFGSVVLTFRVEIKRTVTRASVLSLLGTQRLNLDTPTRREAVQRDAWILATRYLSPQIQDLLRERDVSYVDATGNIFLSAQDPLVLVAKQGASADPWRSPGRPTTSLKGLPAALMVRALADYAPPFTVPDLARVAGTSMGAAYRLVEYLTNEGFITRQDRGPLTTVDWPDLLRRWSQDARFLDANSTRGYLEPRGISSLTSKLRDLPDPRSYAVSGSIAAQPYAPYSEPRLALLYASEPEALADGLGLRAVESGANVIVASPRSPVVYERTTQWQGLTIVAPSQAAADLLGGPGRNPSEGEFLLDWMKENTDAWRRQLDR